MEKFEDDFNKSYDKYIFQMNKRLKKRRQIEFFLKFYMILGGVMVALGGVYFASSLISIDLSDEQSLSLAVSGAGLILSVFSWAWLQFRKEVQKKEDKEKKSIKESKELLWYWDIFEDLSRKVLDNEGIEYNLYSIRDIVYELTKADLISELDLIKIEEAISLRNEFVHGEIYLDDYNIEKVVSTLKDVTVNLENRLKANT